MGFYKFHSSVERGYTRLTTLGKNYSGILTISRLTSSPGFELQSTARAKICMPRLLGLSNSTDECFASGHGFGEEPLVSRGGHTRLTTLGKT